MSIAAGAGYYELVLSAAVIIALVLNGMAPLEILLRRRLRNVTLNVEMDDVSDIALISSTIEGENARVYEVDVEQPGSPASAVFILRLSSENSSHSGMLCSVAELPCVRSVQELIS